MISFVGWYGRQNMGDEAFKEVHQFIFPDQAIEWRDDRSGAIDEQPRQWVLGGGDVLSDFYLKTIPDDAPFTIYGCGVAGDDQFKFLSRNAARIRHLWLRNAQDAERARGLGLPASYSPDIVFQLRDHLSQAEVADPAGPKQRKRLVVFPSANSAQAAERGGDLRQYHYYEYFKRELALVCDFLAEYYDIVFFPMSVNINDNDLLFARNVMACMKRQAAVTLLDGSQSIPEVVKMTREADVVMSMKFHGIVFSILSGTPFLNIGLSRKTQLLCADNGLQALNVTPYGFNFHSLLGAFKLVELPETRAQVTAVGERLAALALEEGQRFRASLLNP